ncbi:MAG: SDR family NAD(P)-dependent oxidoreductase [Rhizobiaceae bacterium]|nr:MAG: SDR family NAD(P)-dependent oxidoreductase [Rhizobiaceae bacterium]
MARSMEGRHVVVTGGSGALGGAVVARFAAAGAICHLPLRRMPEQPAFEVGPNILPIEGIDLSRQEDVDRFYDTVPDLWASVHAAGGFQMAPIVDASLDDFRRMMEINTVTAFACCRAAVRRMRADGMEGRIVNVAARPGLEPRRGARATAYTASKAAIVALTVALAEELKDDRILVNAVAPSTLDTPSNSAQMPNADTSKWVPLKAAAEAIFHLGSPANMASSGAVLPLYGRA